MTTPLPAARPDGFDDDGDGEAREAASRTSSRLYADGVGGGGDVVTLHELFGEGFAGLEHRGRLRGAEDAEATLGELVDEAEGEGEFGADDGEGGLLDGDDVDHLVQVARIDGDAARELGDAAVAGGAEDFRDLRRFAERPDDGVLATTATDNQNLHPYRCSCCRRNSLYSFEASIVVDEVKLAGLFHSD